MDLSITILVWFYLFGLVGWVFMAYQPLMGYFMPNLIYAYIYIKDSIYASLLYSFIM